VAFLAAGQRMLPTVWFAWSEWTRDRGGQRTVIGRLRSRDFIRRQCGEDLAGALANWCGSVRRALQGLTC
jgi:hypothetical protein